MDFQKGCEHCGAVLPVAQLRRLDLRGAVRMVCEPCAGQLAEIAKA